MSSEMKYILEDTIADTRRDITIATLETRILALEQRLNALDESLDAMRAALATPAQQEFMERVARTGLCNCKQCEERRGVSDEEARCQFLADTVDDAEYNAWLEYANTPRAEEY